MYVCLFISMCLPVSCVCDNVFVHVGDYVCGVCVYECVHVSGVYVHQCGWMCPVSGCTKLIT